MVRVYKQCIVYTLSETFSFILYLQDFTLDFYFRQYWHDPRLAFHDLHDEELCISNEMLEQIWWPDTFFANAKDANFHIATTKNAFLRIKPNGDVLQSIRYKHITDQYILSLHTHIHTQKHTHTHIHDHIGLS